MMQVKQIVRNRRYAGITILEVAVGIAIVAALVVALMPVVARAREVSYTARCQHNLKQLGVAFAAYDQDNLGYLPHGQYAGFNGANGTPTGASVVDLQMREWMRLYYPYILSTPISANELTNPYASPNMALIRDQTSVFDCPATMTRVGHFHPINGYKSYPKLFDYLVYNHRRPSSSVIINKLQQLPTRGLLLTDARETDPIYTWGNNFDSGNDDYFLWQLLYFPQGNPAVDGATGYRPGFHHQNGNNALFPDGAAQRLPRTSMQPGYASGNYTTNIVIP